MPAIPDFTDPKWQVSRSDAEVGHSILEGKGQLMLPMKDKFALTHADVKEMVAFVRGFGSGKQVLAAGTSPPVPTPALGELQPQVVVTPAVASPALASDSRATSGLVRAESSAANASGDLRPAPARVPGTTARAPLTLAPVRAPSTAWSIANTERLHEASELYRNNCMACHGQDGHGSLVRLAMPTIPDFASRGWQTGRNNIQLNISILEGRGTFMPPWRGKLSPAQIRDLVSYVRTFGPADLFAAKAPTDDFEERFLQLRKEWEDLDQQIRALSQRQ
jgi:mono/diheme cytochrome c family protein